jgi:hypothetical protein
VTRHRVAEGWAQRISMASELIVSEPTVRPDSSPDTALRNTSCRRHWQRDGSVPGGDLRGRHRAHRSGDQGDPGGAAALGLWAHPAKGRGDIIGHLDQTARTAPRRRRHISTARRTCRSTHRLHRMRPGEVGHPSSPRCTRARAVRGRRLKALIGSEPLALALVRRPFPAR